MSASSGRTGRPPLTEARKAEIRLEIARAAVELFVAQGVTATTGEQIGQAVGVSARTVWRYFPSKESCVRPLFSAGIGVIAARLREWPPGLPLADLFAPDLAAGLLAATGPDGATG
ncbi:helix-turn-helix domain-containing protein, partial [Streptomyces sp. W16]|uniref:TetR/AcrR family transcriptional regulator n=1 Tax=Streptomyces sp. W16 TaxID=3076631 RepID=UPI00295AE179